MGSNHNLLFYNFTTQYNLYRVKIVWNSLLNALPCKIFARPIFDYLQWFRYPPGILIVATLINRIKRLSINCLFVLIRAKNSNKRVILFSWLSIPNTIHASSKGPYHAPRRTDNFQTIKSQLFLHLEGWYHKHTNFGLRHSTMFKLNVRKNYEGKTFSLFNNKRMSPISSEYYLCTTFMVFFSLAFEFLAFEFPQLLY